MFIFKVLPILLLAFLAEGSDLDTALSIMECAQKAISIGVPEIPVPSHSPLLIFKNTSWDEEDGIPEGSMVLNISWAGIPDWNVTGKQLNDDSDPFAVFDFNIHWDKMVLHSNVDANFTDWYSQREYNGTLHTTWEDIAWTGRINVTKRGNDVTAQVNDFDVLWTIGNSTTHSDGFGGFGHQLAFVLDKVIPRGVSSRTFSPFMSDKIKERLNSFWWSTGNLWKLLEWCKKN